jgi:hypothetical protein
MMVATSPIDNLEDLLDTRDILERISYLELIAEVDQKMK